ncbi:hypothetical protein [Thermocoleostomius sinensis]|uniref:Uncharacterized protein n=1 Tax=Thermocoleostomius sinensis A174 TaxID=2016057 RepID=A0A9E8ZHN0_9CYAN|nr:hypothetical protein [Thermocoleostomius sinensis]WAL61380.1 hypothetical protein OXH18_05140 [Thermocoleostomius sinensis A174]
MQALLQQSHRLYQRLQPWLIFSLAVQTIAAFVEYLPNLVIVALIAVFTRYIIQFVKLVIAELGREDAYSWFYPEWVQPTNQLATFFW